MGKIVSIATQLPAYKHRQENILSFMEDIYCTDEIEKRKLKYLSNHSHIKSRFSVIPDYSLPTSERTFYPRSKNLEPFPSIEKRMKWFLHHAAPLCVKAIQKCIEGKISRDKITHLITVSCTGLSAPGLDLEIMEALQLPTHIFRTSVNFMGCYASIHAFKLAEALSNQVPQANVVVVGVEFCTLHFQKENEVDNITSSLLFGDGCAAALIQSNHSPIKGISFQKFYSEVRFIGKRDMSWHLSSQGFRMILSSSIPDLLEQNFEELVTRALRHGALSKTDITHWCIHPGGKRILDAIKKSLSLPPNALSYSYQVLNEYGNMSSVSILFVIHKMLLEFEKNTSKPTLFAAAFGPGLTMETCIASYD